MFKGLIITLGAFALCGTSMAGEELLAPISKFQVSVNGALGYGEYTDVNQGSTGFGRLGMNISNKISQQFKLGLEVGIQNGQRMRLNNDVESTPAYMTILPQVDLLATVTLSFDKTPTFLQFKAGGTYMKGTFDRRSIIDKSNFRPEIQAGGGVSLNRKARVIGFYQRVFGGDPNLSVSNIQLPTQHAAFLGFEYDIS